MNPETNNVIQQQMEKLPPEVRTAITSPDLRKKLKEVGDRNKLHIDQLGILEDETVLVMMGLEDPNNFLDNLVKQVHIERSVAEKVEHEIGEQIFMPIREAMKKFMAAEQPIIGAGENIQNTPVSKLPPIAPRQMTPEASSLPVVSTPPPLPVVPSAPVSTPVVTPPPPVPPKPPVPPSNMAQADTMLSQKTVDLGAASPKTAPSVPDSYKKDPYREPAE